MASDLQVDPVTGTRRTPLDRLAEGEAMLRDRALGMTQAQLMIKYGYSKRTVQVRLQTAIDQRIAHTVDDYRAQQNAALDEITSKWVDQVAQAEDMINRGAFAMSDALIERGHKLRTDALNGLVRVGERRAKLNGLDAPTRVEGEVLTYTLKLIKRRLTSSARRGSASVQEYLDQLLVELDEALGSEWWLDPAKRIAATREDPVLFAWVYLRHHLRLGERGPITWDASQALVRRSDRGWTRLPSRALIVVAT